MGHEIGLHLGGKRQARGTITCHCTYQRASGIDVIRRGEAIWHIRIARRRRNAEGIADDRDRICLRVALDDQPIHQGGQRADHVRRRHRREDGVVCEAGGCVDAAIADQLAGELLRQLQLLEPAGGIGLRRVGRRLVEGARGIVIDRGIRYGVVEEPLEASAESVQVFGELAGGSCGLRRGTFGRRADLVLSRLEIMCHHRGAVLEAGRGLVVRPGECHCSGLVGLRQVLGELLEVQTNHITENQVHLAVEEHLHADVDAAHVYGEGRVAIANAVAGRGSVGRLDGSHRIGPAIQELNLIDQRREIGERTIRVCGDPGPVLVEGHGPVGGDGECVIARPRDNARNDDLLPVDARCDLIGAQGNAVHGDRDARPEAVSIVQVIGRVTPPAAISCLRKQRNVIALAGHKAADRLRHAAIGAVAALQERPPVAIRRTIAVPLILPVHAVARVEPIAMLGDARIAAEAPAHANAGGVVGKTTSLAAPTRPTRVFKTRVGKCRRCVGDRRGRYKGWARRECDVANEGVCASIRVRAPEGQGAGACPRHNNRKREELIAGGKLQGVGIAGHAAVIAIGAGIGHGVAKVAKPPEAYQSGLGALKTRSVAGSDLIHRQRLVPDRQVAHLALEKSVASPIAEAHEVIRTAQVVWNKVSIRVRSDQITVDVEVSHAVAIYRDAEILPAIECDRIGCGDSLG